MTSVSTTAIGTITVNMVYMREKIQTKGSEKMEERETGGTELVKTMVVAEKVSSAMCVVLITVSS